MLFKITKLIYLKMLDLNVIFINNNYIYNPLPNPEKI